MLAVLLLVLAGDHRRADRILRTEMRAARDRGAIGVLQGQLFVSSLLDVRRGRCSAAEAAATECLEWGIETGDVVWTPMFHTEIALVAAGRGHAESCRAHARNAMQLADRLPVECIRDVDDFIGRLELGLGNMFAGSSWSCPTPKVPEVVPEPP